MRAVKALIPALLIGTPLIAGSQVRGRIQVGQSLENAAPSPVKTQPPKKRSNNPVVITGKVVDVDTKQPLADVPIYLEGEELAATTGKDGTFRIEGLPAGSQKLSAWINGYAGYYRYVSVPTIKPCKKDTKTTTSKRQKFCGRYVLTTKLSLQKKSASSFAEGMTTGGKALRDRGRPQPMAMVPGADSTSGFFPPPPPPPNVRIRGVNSFNLEGNPMVMLDGVKSSQSDLDALNPNDIESIEVVKGPSASGYGAGSENGVIVVKRKKKN
jgi:TonB-dependent starch-binding outer membrane protein SusC